MTLSVIPKTANNPDSYKTLIDSGWKYPTQQLNGYEIEDQYRWLEDFTSEESKQCDSADLHGRQIRLD